MSWRSVALEGRRPRASVQASVEGRPGPVLPPRETVRAKERATAAPEDVSIAAEKSSERASERARVYVCVYLV